MAIKFTRQQLLRTDETVESSPRMHIHQIWSLFTLHILQWVMYSTLKQRCHRGHRKKRKKENTEPFLCRYIKIVLLQKYKLDLLMSQLRSKATQESAAKVP